MGRRRKIILILGLVGMVTIVLLGAAYYVGFRQISLWRAESDDSASTEAEQADNLREIANLKRRMERLKPNGTYLIIDTGENKLTLMRGERIVREAVVSCGSGGILEEPGGKKRTWIFDTPRGEFAIKSKITNPYWVKPDWAFIEEGEPIPKKIDDRLEAGTLGDYALGFGDGYFIHGTLYTRLLGRNVTHGCVRVGDEDLEVVFRSVSIGTKIFIY